MKETESTSVLINRPVIVHRIIQVGLFLTLIWKWDTFRYLPEIYAAIPIEDAFFPNWLRSTWTLCIAFLVAVGAIIVSFFTGSRTLQRVSAWLTISGLTVLCIHQGTYNDMTFVTAWWTSLWALWYVRRDWQHNVQDLLRRAALLSRMIISMILLGGAVGKLTPEYWTGAVFYDIYFVDRDFWIFNWLRVNLEVEKLREFATWYSRLVIVTETAAGGLLWLLPARIASLIAILLLASIAIFSNFLLFSVLSCLIGLAAVGFFVPRSSVN